ncbi:MAG: DUF5005 domain-containing protein [Dysgonomonas sp.]|nr:DUF5005 domain-containing protein [Dysgonomonas sp.]
MRNIYSYIKASKRKQTFLLCLFLISVTLYSCFKLKSLDHPTTAQTYSHFDVTFVCEHTNPIKTEGRGFLGVLLPKGWRMQDYTNYVVRFPNASDNISGRLCYDQYYTDALSANLETPEGYYWWGGRSIDNLELLKADDNKSDDFTFTLRIYTDDKTGNFTLRYVVGTDGNSENPVSNGKYVDEQRTITVTQGNTYPQKKDTNWELIPNGGWDSNIKYYSDKDYDGFFTRWNGWTGSDVAITTLLPDGRSVWVWGDTYTGYVTSNRARSADKAQFVRNTFIVQEKGMEDFSAFYMTNEGELGSVKPIIPYYDDNGDIADEGLEWYWPSEGVIYYRDGIPELQVLLHHGKKTGDGTWDITTASTDIAVFSLPDVKLERIVKNKHIENSNSISFPGQILRDDDGIVYIYGSANYGICGTATFVARAVNGDLTREWEFYNIKTNTWSADHAWQEDSDWLDYKVSEYCVFPFKDGGKYFAIEQAPCFSRETYIHEADSPIGPFRNRKLVGMLPEEISTGDFYTYIPALHPQFSKNGELMYCVSKNHYLEFSDNFNAPGSANTYLPYFFRVKNWRDKLNIVDMDITDNKGTLTAQYEDDLDNLTDNDATTIYAISSASGWIQYESPSTARLNRYTITSAPDSQERDPMHWKVSGSNDGVNWTVLDERYYAEFEEREQTINYTVPITDNMYTHFRLDVLATRGGGNIQIAEWQMFGEFEYAKGETAELEEVTVNGKSISIDNTMNVNILPSDDAEIQVNLKAKDFGVISGVDESFTTTVDKAGIEKYNIKVTSEDGNEEKEYELVLNRWFSFDEVVKVKWNNTLMLYLNRLDEYDISAYQWYQNGNAINGATGKTYSAGPKKTDLLDQSSEYHIEMKTPDGNMRSEAKQVKLKSMNVQIYPNPVRANEVITVEADMDEEQLIGATIEVYNISGNKVSTTKVQGYTTTINIPFGIGTYMVKFKSKELFEKTLKVIVK